MQDLVAPTGSAINHPNVEEDVRVWRHSVDLTIAKPQPLFPVGKLRRDDHASPIALAHALRNLIRASWHAISGCDGNQGRSVSQGQQYTMEGT